MTNDTLAITRRRFIGALTAVGFASAGAGAGTIAMLSDSETQSATVTAGTINLRLGDENQTVQFLNESNITAGASGTAAVKLENTGSRAGRVIVTVASLTNDDNGHVSGEQNVDTDTNTGAGYGELQEHLEVRAESQDGSALWADWTELQYLPDNIINNPGYQLASGESGTFELDWRLPSETSKVVNSDSIELRLSFELRQTTGG